MKHNASNTMSLDLDGLFLFIVNKRTIQNKIKDAVL